MKYPALKIEKLKHSLKIKNFKLKISNHPFLGRFYPKKAIYRRALAVFLAFLVLVPSVFLVFRPSQVSADWLDDSYAYRQTIRFTYSADLTDTSMRLTVSNTNTLVTAGKMQTDCDDSRFADSNGKVLRFKLVSGCNSASTVYDVIFPTVINGSNRAYFYYGNPSALSKSDSTVPIGTIPVLLSFNSEEKAPSPALSLKFDEGTGTTAQDSSSNNNDGTISSASWKTQESCLSSNCLFFDGVDDVVTVTNADSIDLDRRLAAGFTFDTWVRVNSDGEGNVGQIFSKGGSTYLRVTNEGTDGKADLEASLDLATTDATLSIADGIELNKWTHIAVSYTDDSDDEITIYINGTLKGSSTNGSGAPTADTNNLLIGGTTAANFNGFIDEFKIYPFEETASQIKTSAASRIPSVHGISTSFGDDQSYLSNGLVGWWKMDDGVNNPCASGVDKACDNSGNGNVGTWTGNVASTSGKFGNATTYDGTGDYVSIADSSTVDITGSGSFSAWIYPTSLSGLNSILGKRDASAIEANYALRTDGTTTDELNFYFSISGAWQVYTTTNADLAINNWYLITATYDQNTVRIYKNGQLLSGSCTLGVCTGALQPDNNTLGIGRPGDLTSQYFTGKIDDVRIYNRALSPSEVTRLYDWAPGPVGWWKMDENTGGVAYDSSGNGNTGLNKGTYYMPLTISNSGSTLTDYQVSVTVNTSTLVSAGHMQSDCDDARFYDSDGTTALNYWIESGCNTATTKFWIKIPSITNPGKTIYMYYGDSSATAASSGTNTFMFFDDFNSALDWTSKWQSSAPSKETEFYTSGGLLEAQDVALGDYRLVTQNSFNDFIVESRIKEIDSGNTGYFYQSLTSSTATWMQTDMTRINGNAVVLQAKIGNVAADGGSGVDNTWYRSKIVLPNSGNAFSYLYSDDLGTLHVSQTGTPTVSRTAYINFLQWYSFGTGYADWVFARQYAATEPTVTAGSETAVNLPWTRGKFGSALKFDGVDDYVSVATTSSILNFERNNAFSISGWIKTTSNTVSLFSKMSSSAPYAGYELLLDGSGKLGLFLDNTWSSNTLYVTGAQTVNNGTWKYVTATYDGSSTPAGIKLYIDGVEDGKSTTFDSLTASIQNGVPVTIGSRQQSRYVNGAIDELRVYDYVRTPKQIISDMNGGHPAVGSPVGSAVAQWNFDEGFGTTAHSSGSCATCSGTLTNMDSPATYGSGWTQSGKFGKALNFDGGDDYVQLINNTETILGTNPDSYSYSAWFKTATTTGYAQPISDYNYSGTDLNYGMNLYFYNGALRASVRSSGNTYNTTPDLSGYNNNTWHFATVTVDKSALTQNLYVDGVLKATIAIGNYDYIDATPLLAGAAYNGSYVNFFPGAIDNVSIYNYALNAQEIKVAYNRGKSVVMGAVSTNPDGSATNSAARAYCPPGNSEGNCAAGSDPSPVAEWNFNENTGQSVNDTSGNANTGTLGANSSVGSDDPTWTRGKIGRALKFDGVDDYVITTNNIGITGSSARTLSAWVYIYSFNADCWNTVTRYGKFEFNLQDFGIIYDCDSMWFAGYGTGDFDSNLSVTKNTWYHMVVTYNGTTVRTFLNGIEGTSAVKTLNTTNSQLGIGKQISGGSGYYANAIIDDVRIYNYARTPAQVAWDYNRGRPIGWWDFDECQGTTAHDLSGNGNNGTITIGATVPQSSAGNCSTVDTATAWYNGRTGKFNSALSFDGVDDYVALPSPPPSYFYPKTNEGFTVTTWIKTTQTSQGYIITHSTGGAWSYDSWRLAINEAYTGPNELAFHTVAQGGSGYAVAMRKANAGVNDGNWHLVVITRDTSGNWIMYVDGKSVATASWNGDVQDNNYRMTIGAIYVVNTSSYGSYFTGLIDDVRIYNYALTPSQIKLLYNGDSAVRFGPSQGSP